ncbi:MAG: N-acetylmuramoyl-L-alanine amidase [Clostridia bacterium]|nr:N-acetylmuramoyl-L-alanine amidase [Clostridia bacterium]
MDKHRIILWVSILLLAGLFVVDALTGADAERKVRVIIDPGHGGQDSGSTYDGVEEKNLNLKIAQYLAEELEKRGVSYKLTREDDTFVSLSDRANIANQYDGDVFISIHHNAIKNAASANGTETLYFPSKDKMLLLSGEELAQIVQNQLVSQLGTRDRGTVARSNLAVIRKTNMAACIAEIGYLSNSNERGQMVSESFQRAAAKALADAIQEALTIIDTKEP